MQLSTKRDPSDPGQSSPWGPCCKDREERKPRGPISSLGVSDTPGPTTCTKEFQSSAPTDPEDLNPVSWGGGREDMGLRPGPLRVPVTSESSDLRLKEGAHALGSWGAHDMKPIMVHPRAVPM